MDSAPLAVRVSVPEPLRLYVPWSMRLYPRSRSRTLLVPLDCVRTPTPAPVPVRKLAKNPPTYSASEESVSPLVDIDSVVVPPPELWTYTPVKVSGEPL